MQFFFPYREKNCIWDWVSLNLFQKKQTNSSWEKKKTLSDNGEKIKVVQLFETECDVDLKNFILQDIFNNFWLLVFLDLGAV